MAADEPLPHAVIYCRSVKQFWRDLKETQTKLIKGTVASNVNSRTSCSEELLHSAHDYSKNLLMCKIGIEGEENAVDQTRRKDVKQLSVTKMCRCDMQMPYFS